MKITRLHWTLILPAAMLTQPIFAAGGGGKIGDRIANLTFKDIRYLPRTLDDFPNKKAFALIFLNTTCPVAQRYLPTLNQLDKEYRDRGVQFLGLNVGPDDSIVSVAAQAVRHGVEFPVVKDFDAACARTLSVQRTPEVVLLDDQRRIRYRGRIDDQYRLGGTRKAPSRHDLKEAIDELLAGREVTTKETPVDGCLIQMPEGKRAERAVTFAEHVAPLIQKHCQECHRPGTAAPFALITYEQVASKANAVAEVVAEQRMPPWFASPDHKEFVNRRGLTAEERETILQWARGGKARGDSPTPNPSPKLGEGQEAKNGWLIGKPDLILKAPEHPLQASGDIPYKYEFLPYVFLEDTWVQGIQILPDNARVVHHCNMAYLKVGENFKKSNFITGTVPGGEPMTLPDGVGFRIPKGSVLVLQIHYITTGKPERCRVSVGLKYASGVVQKQLRHVLLADYRFAIPPGAPAHPVKASKTLDRDVDVVGLFVHMHLRGRDMTFTAHHPDGKSEELLLVPNYNFDWQMPYRYEPGKKRLAKGTRIECVAHYDNSPFNPYNPDPKATVRDGPQTYHEMMNGFVFYTGSNERLNLQIDPKTGKVRTGK